MMRIREILRVVFIIRMRRLRGVEIITGKKIGIF